MGMTVTEVGQYERRQENPETRIRMGYPQNIGQKWSPPHNILPLDMNGS